MRLLTFSTTANPMPRLGALSGGRIVDVSAASSGRLPGTMLALIQQGEDVRRRVRAVVDERGGDPGISHAPDEVRWHAPIPRPLKNVFCLGLNYVAHATRAPARVARKCRFPRRR